MQAAFARIVAARCDRSLVCSLIRVLKAQPEYNVADCIGLLTRKKNLELVYSLKEGPFYIMSWVYGAWRCTSDHEKNRQHARTEKN